MQKIEGRGFSNLREWRRNFGSGGAGRKAFRLIAGGSDSGLRYGCNKRAIETVDYDVFGEGDLLPSCGSNHSRSMQEDITFDLKERGTVFGKNGFGRA